MDSVIDSGLPGVGPIRWGTHCCHFYETSEDLADLLVPYFKAGLEGNERAIWVTCEPLPVERAVSALRNAVPDLDRRMKRGQISICDYRDWYKRNDKLGVEDVLRGWMQLMNDALAEGYTGLRATGNTYFLEAEDWDSFNEYESKVSGCFCDNRIVALCSYCTGRCNAGEVMDVVHTHEFALARRRGNWTLIESAAMKQAKEELRRANLDLEGRVTARTADLSKALAQMEVVTADLRQALADKDVLLQEVHHRVKNNLQIIGSLLALKASRSKDPILKDAFNDTMRRITAMSLIHQALYSHGETSSRIEFAAYLDSLARALHASFGLPATVAITVLNTVSNTEPNTASATVSNTVSTTAPRDAGAVDLNTAVPLGLIAAELISNAFKHAFPRGSGHVEIAFEAPQPGSPGLLRVQDDGAGMPEEHEASGAGLSLLRAIARQIGGSLDFERLDQGTAAVLRFLPPMHPQPDGATPARAGSERAAPAETAGQGSLWQDPRPAPAPAG